MKQEEYKVSKWVCVHVFENERGIGISIEKGGGLGRVALAPDELPALIAMLSDEIVPAVEAMVKEAAAAKLAEIRRLEAIAKPPEKMKVGR